MNVKCDLRPIARDRFNLLIKCDLIRPIYTAHIHSVLYHQFNSLVYRKFMIDIWEDACGFLSGKSKAVLVDVLYRIISPYTNMNHSCPYTGNVFVSMKNFSTRNFAFEPLLPSGRYHTDIHLAESHEGSPFFTFKIYYKISDHRLWH